MEIEWKDKDELPPVGWRGLAAYTEEGCDDWCDFHYGVVMGVNGDYVWIAHHGKFQRVHHIGSIEFQDIETPQQREERELCEDIDSAYDLAPDDLQIPVNLYVAQLLLQMGYRKQ